MSFRISNFFMRRQNDIRLVGLQEEPEGGDAIQFLQYQIPKWIPALQGKTIEIECGHSLYAKDKYSKNRP